jgi:hypothetical protein
MPQPTGSNISLLDKVQPPNLTFLAFLMFTDIVDSGNRAAIFRDLTAAMIFTRVRWSTHPQMDQPANPAGTAAP